MAKFNLIARTLLICMIALFLLEGCALIDKFFGKEEEKDASELMSEGTEAFEKGRFLEAKEAFQIGRAHV